MCKQMNTVIRSLWLEDRIVLFALYTTSLSSLADVFEGSELANVCQIDSAECVS